MKHNNQLNLLLASTFVFIMVFLAGCRKEFSSYPRERNSLPSDLPTTNATISGFIYDTELQPVAGAIVNAGNSTAYTNQYGLFILENTLVSAYNAKITISKNGFFSLVKSMSIQAGANNYLRAQLYPRTLTGSFESSKEGNISMNNGAFVNIPANSIINASTGNNYTGRVNVYMYWLNPEDLFTLDKMPGDLRGISNENTEAQLISYGMINVELEGDNKEKLQLNGKNKATLNFPLSPNLVSRSQPTIPLWHFDELQARWIEEGSAQKKDNSFIAEVGHFSTWNADYAIPGPFVNYCITIVDENNKPYMNSAVSVHRPNEVSGGHGYTDENGKLCMLIPVGIPLKLDIVGEFVCPQADLSKSIGPFDVKYLQKDIDTIVVRKNPGKMITVKGTAVDCNNKPVTDGYIQASIKGKGYIGRLNNGNFEVTLLRCPSDQELRIFGVNAKTNLLSPEKSFHIAGLGVVQDVGEIMICGDPEKTRNNALLAYYPFDGDVKDYSGNKLDGIINGTLEPVEDHLGVTGKAFHFLPGNNITIKNSEDKNPYPMTFSVWFKVDDDMADSWGHIFAKYASGTWNGFYFQVYNYAQNLNPPGWAYMGAYMNSLANNTSGEYGQRWFNARIEKGKWVHAVYIVDDSGAKYIINNVLIDQKEWKGTPKPCTAQWPWLIGGFKGVLDEFRVYNRVLTDSEIKYLYEH